MKSSVSLLFFFSLSFWVIEGLDQGCFFMQIIKQLNAWMMESTLSFFSDCLLTILGMVMSLWMRWMILFNPPWILLDLVKNFAIIWQVLALCIWCDWSSENYGRCPVGWGCRIHWLHLCRGVRPLPMSILDMTLNNQMVRL